MIDQNNEELIPLTAVADQARLPYMSRDNRPDSSTVKKWATEGIGGIKLEVVYRFGRRYTTQGAIDRFIGQVGPSTGTSTAEKISTR